MKKVLCSLLVIMAMMLCMVGCGGQALSEEFDEATLKTSANEVIALLNSQDYTAVCELFREDVKKTITPEALKEALSPIYESLGEFTEYGEATAVGQTDKKTGDNYATVVAMAKYKNGNATFTISYDAQMQLIGLYMK